MFGLADATGADGGRGERGAREDSTTATITAARMIAASTVNASRAFRVPARRRSTSDYVSRIGVDTPNTWPEPTNSSPLASTGALPSNFASKRGECSSSPSHVALIVLKFAAKPPDDSNVSMLSSWTVHVLREEINSLPSRSSPTELM